MTHIYKKYAAKTRKKGEHACCMTSIENEHFKTLKDTTATKNGKCSVALQQPFAF